MRRSWYALMKSLFGREEALHAPTLGDPHASRPVPAMPLDNEAQLALWHEAADLHAALGECLTALETTLPVATEAGVDLLLMYDAVYRMKERFGWWGEGERWEVAPPLPVTGEDGHLYRFDEYGGGFPPGRGRHLVHECPRCAEIQEAPRGTDTRVRSDF